MITWLIYMGILLYWEIVFHIGIFGFTVPSPWILIGQMGLLTSLQAFLTGITRKRHRRKVFWALMVSEYLMFGVQTVYFTIFRQPLQLQAMIQGGEDALTSYWKEALMGILKASPILVLLALPLTAAAVCFYGKRKLTLQGIKGIHSVRVSFVFGISLLLFWMSLELGKIVEADYYQEYTEFYAPDLVIQDMGVLTMVQRDIGFEMEALADQVYVALGWEESVPAMGEMPEQSESSEEMPEQSGSSAEVPEQPGSSAEVSEQPGSSAEVSEQTEPSGEAQVPDEESAAPEKTFNEILLDYEKLSLLSEGDKEKTWLAEYIRNLEPTQTNEYTGMFEGYNLIYITAEGFSTYAIDAELTPTLYKLANSGFVCTNFYAPLWQTSTSDGEYVNLTGMIPDGQFSMNKTKDNNMAYALPAFFGSDNCLNMAYHNNTLSYYERHLSHPNLGYDFKAAKLGELDESEWGKQIFYMENANRWPASDLEMMQATVPEYIGADRFNVYYMTVSGHMYYSFTGNSMSSKNRDAVAGLDMSENARAYIACHIELDKALESLLAQLEAAGKLENTVIALSTDHYPYAMTEEQYEELAGRDLSADRDTYRNTLILWNGGMEENVMVTKPCCSVDILPTLLNLFGFDYDSRMYAGRDILSDAEGMVIFNDRSFVTDTVIYDRKTKTTTWRKELSEEEQDAYLTRMKQEVKDRYQFSAYMLRENYYDVLKQSEVLVPAQ